MEIIRALHRGVCCGVATSIFSADKALKSFPNQPVYLIGDLVHNKYTVNRLKKKGIICLNTTIDDHGDKSCLIRAVPNKSVVILSAHGSSPQLYQIAKEKKLIVIDTTCFYVSKTHKLVYSAIEKNKHVLFIGKKNHDETNAILEIGGSNITLIESLNDIDIFHHKHQQNSEIFENLVLTNQTTLSIYDFDKLLKYAIKLMPKIVYFDEICNATTLRQVEINRHVGSNIDLAIVIGDQHSNNALRLLDLCWQKLTKNSVLISNKSEINEKLLLNSLKIFITASASAPFRLIFDIENKINSLNKKFKIKNFLLN